MSHTNRAIGLTKLKKCPIKRIPYDMLNEKEIEFVEQFIITNSHLKDREFKGKAHYLFLDDKVKLPHHIEIIEVLMSICVVS